MGAQRIFILVLLLVWLVISTAGCAKYIRASYRPPIPAENYFEVKFKLYIYTWEDFQKVTEFYFAEPQEGCVGLTVKRFGEKLVIVPRGKDGTIDLENLGHEIFYHVIYNHSH